MSEPTRLLAVSHTGFHSEAGLDLLPVLQAARGRSWKVLAAVPTGPLAARLEAEGVRQIRLPKSRPWPRPRALGHAIAGGSRLIASKRIARVAIGADVVLTDSLFALPVLRITNSHLPVVFVTRDVIKSPDRLALLRACASMVALALAPSELVAAPLRAQGLAVQIVQIAPSWPGLPPATGAPTHPTIGLIGPLGSREEQDLILEALAGLPDREVIVELVGDGLPGESQVETLERRAAASGLAGRVRFLQALDDPVGRIRHWTVALLPGLDSGKIPVAAKQAARLGLPVLITGHRPDPEVLAKSALAVPSGDPRALAASIRQVLDDHNHRHANAAAVRQSVAVDRASQDDGLLHVVDAFADIARIGRAARERRTTLYVVPDFEPAIGGTTRQTRNQANALIRRGHGVAILTRRLDASWPRREVMDGLDVHRVGPRRWSPFGEKLSVLAVAGWLGRHGRRVGLVQVVMYADYVLSCATMGKLRSTIMLWAGRGDATDALAPAPGVLRDLQRRVRRSMLRRCEHVALTASLAQELRSLGLHSVMIPVPIDRRWYRPPTATERQEARTRLGLHDNRFVVIYTGHLRRLKAVDRLIAAFAMLAATGRPASLLLVGAGTGREDDCEDELRAQVVDAGLQDAVTFTGVVRDVRTYLWAADAFVLASTREGMPNSLVEAMACGLACIAPKSASGDDVLSQHTGMVPANNEPAVLFDALTWLCDHSEERRSLGIAAAMAVEPWDIEKVIECYEHVYKRLTSRRHIPPWRRILLGRMDSHVQR